MRIVSLNTWKNEGDYLRRLGLMRDGLAALSPDVVCLQEAFVGAGHDTATWLAAELGMDCHAAPARAKLRQHGAEMVHSTSGLAILTRHVGMSDTLALTSEPADGERIAQRLDLIVDGWDLRILNLHLTHLRDAQRLRGQQLSEALAWADEGLFGSLVVAGDLNAAADDPALAALGLKASPRTVHGARQGLAPPGGGAVDHCVLHHADDWRCVGSFRALEAADADGWFPSDHAAVGIDLD